MQQRRDGAIVTATNAFRACTLGSDLRWPKGARNLPKEFPTQRMLAKILRVLRF